MNDRTAKILLLIVSTVVCMLVAEFVLRSFGFYGERHATMENLGPVDDPILDYRGRPNLSWVSKGHRYQTNHHGFRDYSYDYRKPADTRRIVVVGDSVTHGHGVEMEEIYTKVLERRLNQDSQSETQWQVITLSLGALNTPQEVRLLTRDGLRYDPDVIVVGYTLNDPASGASLRTQQENRANEGTVRRIKRLGRQSSLLFYTYRALQRLQWWTRETLGWSETSSYVERDYFSKLHDDPGSWARVRAAFRELEAIETESGIPIYLVIFPILHDFADYNWLRIHDQVSALARGHGLEVLDLLETFEPYDPVRLQIASGDPIHPNKRGHELAGEALYEFLRSQGL